MSNAALNWAFALKTGSASSKLVLVTLADLADDRKSHIAFPCVKELCERTELNRKTVIAAINHLLETDRIIDTHQRVGKTKLIPVYQFHHVASDGNGPKNGTVPEIKQSQKVLETVPKSNGNGPKNGTRIPLDPSLSLKDMIPASSLSPEITELHQTYCRLTGLEIKIAVGEINRGSSWYLFMKSGFTKNDLECVIRYLKKEIHAERRNKGCLKFDNLIAQLDKFEQDLAMAHAEARNTKPPMTPKQRAVEQLRPIAVDFKPQDTANTAKPISYYIEQLRSAAQ